MPAGRSSGFTLVAMLVLVALVSAGLAVVGPLWSQQVKRERERDLLRIGVLYAQAIAEFHAMSPGSQRQWPTSVDDLLLDRRFVGTVRHLRKAYADPVAPHLPWVPVRDASGRIIGMHSASTEEPLAMGEVHLDDRVLPPARRYADWTFLAVVKP